MRLILIAMLVAACSAFAQRGAGGHAGFARGANGHFGAPRVAHSHTGVAVVPYPVFYGGYSYVYDPSQMDGGYGVAPSSGYENGYGAPPPPDSGMANGAPGQAPVVIINQSFHPDSAAPVLHDYSNTTLPQPGASPASPSGVPANARPDDQPTIYLIAMKDHTIFPAVAYWVEGDTLNYITSEGSQNRASLALVDRDFSAQLNRERNVEFKLPAPK